MTKIVTIQAQQKWEYCSETRRTDSALMPAINELGQHGWELVDVLHYKDPKGELSWTAFLKRPSAGHAAGAAQSNSTGAGATIKTAGAAAMPQPAGFDLSGDEFALKTDKQGS